MKVLKNLLIFVPLSHLFGIGFLALLCAAYRNAADPSAAAAVIGIISPIAAGLVCGLFCALKGHFDVRQGLLAGALLAAINILAGLLAGHFHPMWQSLTALAAAMLLPPLFCLKKRTGHSRSVHKNKKRAAARYYAK